MNILILATHLNRGGISRYCLNLAKGFVKGGHHVTIATSGGEWVEEVQSLGAVHKTIPIRTKSITSPKILISLCILLPFLRREKIHIVHSNTRVTQVLGYLLYRFSGTPYISAFHGFYRPHIVRKLLPFSGIRTIAVSHAVKKHLVEDLKMQEEKIWVVHNGIDGSEFSSRKMRKVDLGFQEADFLIGILGRISEEKGHLLAVQAYRLLQEHYHNAYLLISGKGRLEDELRLFIQEVGLDDRVRLGSWQADQFLDVIDLLLVPSRKEGFGYAILEAFAKGVAVIGFNIGGISEIIQDRQNGMLFDNYDGSSLKKVIEEVMVNEELYHKLIQEARRSVRSFSLEKMATSTETIYREALHSMPKYQKIQPPEVKGKSQ
ncbi:MAG: glycosyltransferase family 4 protein [Candidatus Omnitrophota bacterium]|nr:MAG: glycosyltransferase family 4 protein [Candidatus Omnitrophota bacterium]